VRTGARKFLAASLAPGGFHDQVVVVRDLKAPLAVQIIPGAGHAPQWETPLAFGALLVAFIAETE
jgi:hypothetical protein